MDDAVSKTKRSTIACTFCRDRKIKCENNNDGQPCLRCTGTGRECEYKPVSTNPATERTSPISIPPNIVAPGPGMSTMALPNARPTAGPIWGRPDPPVNPTSSRSPMFDVFPFQGQPQGQVSYALPNQDYQRPSPNPIPNTFPNQHQLHLQQVWQNPTQHDYAQGFQAFGNSSNPNHDHVDNNGSQTEDGGR